MVQILKPRLKLWKWTEFWKLNIFFKISIFLKMIYFLQKKFYVIFSFKNGAFFESRAFFGKCGIFWKWCIFWNRAFFGKLGIFWKWGKFWKWGIFSKNGANFENGAKIENLKCASYAREIRVKCAWILCRNPRVIYKWRARVKCAWIRVIYLRPYFGIDWCWSFPVNFWNIISNAIDPTHLPDCPAMSFVFVCWQINIQVQMSWVGQSTTTHHPCQWMWCHVICVLRGFSKTPIDLGWLEAKP